MNKLHPVKSSSLAAVGYHPETRTLAVRFAGKSDKVHHYKEVSPEAHAGLMAAESIGKHFAAHIKPHHAHSVVVGDTAPA